MERQSSKRRWTADEDRAIWMSARRGLPDPARSRGQVRAFTQRGASTCVSARGDSAPTGGPVTAGGELGGRPRSRAGIAAARSWRAAVCATAAASAGPLAGASVLAAGARLQTCGARIVRRTESGQTGRAGGNVRKHLHLEIDALLVGTGARCLVVDADADLDET